MPSGFRRLVIFCLLTSFAPLLVGSSAAESAPEVDNFTGDVIVTAVPSQKTFIQALFQAAGCEERFRVLSLLSNATDPERYSATPGDLELVRSAILLVQIGHAELVFEKRIEQALSFPADRLLRQSELIEANHEDPHVWLSAEANIKMLEKVVVMVSSMHPELADRLAEAESKLKVMIKTELQQFKEKLALASEKNFVVFHPAWGYLAEALGLRQFHLEDHGKEPSPFALARRIAEARQQGIHIVIVQPQFPRASAEALAKEIDARVFEINPLDDSWFVMLQKFSEVFLVGGDGR
ncbi:MAG: zinc ABC transporter substrate-binding protein [bacterium]|nr:zinc ABC transporter substrate-binding protein [bacterium]